MNKEMKLFLHHYMSYKKDTLVSIARKFSMTLKEIKEKWIAKRANLS